MMKCVFVGLQVVVINKACHVDLGGCLSICRIVRGAIGRFGLEMEVYAAFESPHGWGCATTLASPVNACVVGMGIGLVGDTQTGFYVLLRVQACDPGWMPLQAGCHDTS
jgi:hypothetical protein